MSTHAESLQSRINDRTAVVGIVGLGYVGLPLAIAFADRGFSVLGFDVDPAKPKMIARGECYIRHLDGNWLAPVVEKGLLTATSDFSRMDEPDAILICVPTPLTPQREPDMRYVDSSARQVASSLRPGQLVVLESTTYPGTTDELLRGVLDRSGLLCGQDYFLAFSPEREDPGNRRFRTTNTPKVVGGVDSVSGDLAESLYAAVIDDVVRVSTARAAEATKLTENIFRAVNIALVNELKMVYARLGIDIWEVLDAAETKPFGFMRFNPGPGFGGHCIPLDPFYLSWKAREVGMSTRFIELAGETNVRMPEYVVEKLQLVLNDHSKPMRGSRILVLGLAYKKDIDDPRESPAFEIIAKLHGLGAEVSYHDPHIPEAPRMRSWPDLPPMHSVDLNGETVAFDAAIIITDHAAVDYDQLLEQLPVIVDTRGVYREPQPKVVKA